MVDRLLRIPKEQALTPVAIHLLRRIRPTTITLIAFGIGSVAALAIWQHYYLLGLALWLLNRVFDGLDGTLARITEQQSDFGGYLYAIGDVTPTSHFTHSANAYARRVRNSRATPVRCAISGRVAATTKAIRV
jgi:hypothetical protein